MLKRRTQPMTDGKKLQTTKRKLESWSKNVTKTRQTVLFIAKKQVIVSFCARGYTREV